MTEHTRTKGDGIMSKKAFLICPVRGHDPAEFVDVVQWLEELGLEVYWPPRDTNQDDPIGYEICRLNLLAMKSCDFAHILWDGKSEGCLFDLGMAFALGKQLVVIEMLEPTGGKSFQNMAREWAHISKIEQWHLGDLEKP